MITGLISIVAWFAGCWLSLYVLHRMRSHKMFELTERGKPMSLLYDVSGAWMTALAWPVMLPGLAVFWFSKTYHMKSIPLSPSWLSARRDGPKQVFDALSGATEEGKPTVDWESMYNSLYNQMYNTVGTYPNINPAITYTTKITHNTGGSNVR